MTGAGPHVLMTADAVGGVWTYALDLARGLRQAQARTTLAVLGPVPSQAQMAQAAAIGGLEVVETGLPLDWLASSPDEVLDAAVSLRSLARATGADLVHLNSPALAACGGFAAPLLGVSHSCLATWWGAVRDGPMPEDFVWRHRLLSRGLQICDAIVAPSRAFAKATGEAHAIRPPRVVHNGRAGAEAHLLDEPTRERAVCVMTAGRLWDEGKNVRVLDEAAAALPAPVYAIGPLNGPAGEHLPLRHMVGLGPLGNDELRAQIARAAIFASPALYEPFGLTVLEAAQAGCALVLSDIATFRELWDGAALFAPSNDAAAWAATLSGLLADPAAQRSLAAAARMRAQRYSVERMSQGVMQAYAEIAPALASAFRQEAVA